MFPTVMWAFICNKEAKLSSPIILMFKFHTTPFQGNNRKVTSLWGPPWDSHWRGHSRRASRDELKKEIIIEP